MVLSKKSRSAFPGKMITTFNFINPLITYFPKTKGQENGFQQPKQKPKQAKNSPDGPSYSQGDPAEPPPMNQADAFHLITKLI